MGLSIKSFHEDFLLFFREWAEVETLFVLSRQFRRKRHQASRPPLAKTSPAKDTHNFQRRLPHKSPWLSPPKCLLKLGAQRRYVQQIGHTLKHSGPAPMFLVERCVRTTAFQKKVLKGTSVDLVAGRPRGTAMTTISLLYIALSACVSIGFVIAGLAADGSIIVPPAPNCIRQASLPG